jgi:hypothetical protein
MMTQRCLHSIDEQCPVYGILKFPGKPLYRRACFLCRERAGSLIFKKIFVQQALYLHGCSLQSCGLFSLTDIVL